MQVKLDFQELVDFIENKYKIKIDLVSVDEKTLAVGYKPMNLPKVKATLRVEEINNGFIARLGYVSSYVVNNSSNVSSDNRGTKMCIGIMASEIIFTVLLCKNESFLTRVKILSLVATGWNPVFKYVDKVLLKRFKSRHRHIESTLLSNYRAGSVMRVNHYDTVLNVTL